MGRRGPPPNPASERSKTGRNTLYVKTSQPLEHVPMPAWLSGVAADFWDQHADGLMQTGRLRLPQADAFGILCQLAADCQQLAAQVAAEGWITATDKGQAASPVAKLLRDARRDFVSLAKEFGMTAAAAARIPQEPSDGDEADDEAAVLRAFTSGE